MFIGPDKSRLNIRNSIGFTLLEIMLAVAILGMMSLAIFRFVQSNMIAMYLSSNTAAADAQYGGVGGFLFVGKGNPCVKFKKCVGRPLNKKYRRDRKPG